MNREIVAVPTLEELEYARLLIEIEVRRRRLAALEAERATLELALSQFAAEVKARVGSLKEDIRQTRLKIEEIRRRTMRLRADPDADPLEVEREVAEELAARQDEARAEATARQEALAEAPPRRPHDAGSAELLRLYRELAKRFHPDLARTPEERQRRAELMLRINVAYRDRDVAALQALLLEAERFGPVAPLRLHRQRLAWALRERARLDREIANLEARLALLRRSDTYALWRSPADSDAVLADLEARTRARLHRERDCLDEATTAYHRLLARHRRWQLLRQRAAAPPPPRHGPVPVGAPTASD